MDDLPFNFDKTFHRMVSEIAEPLADYLAGGQCKDWNDYQRISGRLAGLQEAKNIFDLLVRNWENR